MDLQKFNKAKEIRSKITDLEVKIADWEDAIELRGSQSAFTKTKAVLDVFIEKSLFEYLKNANIKFLKEELNKLEIEFKAL